MCFSCWLTRAWEWILLCRLAFGPRGLLGKQVNASEVAKSSERPNSGIKRDGWGRGNLSKKMSMLSNSWEKSQLKIKDYAEEVEEKNKKKEGKEATRKCSRWKMSWIRRFSASKNLLRLFETDDQMSIKSMFLTLTKGKMGKKWGKNNGKKEGRRCICEKQRRGRMQA